MGLEIRFLCNLQVYFYIRQNFVNQAAQSLGAQSSSTIGYPVKF